MTTTREIRKQERRRSSAAGTHADRRTKRNRTRRDRNQRAIKEQQ